MHHQHVIDISTEVFRLLRRQGPRYITWGEEKPGPTQKILVGDDVYNEFIDRAIAHHQTLDQVVREACAKTIDAALVSCGSGGHTKQVGGAN